MTRCECHEMAFSEVLEYARGTGIHDIGTLCDRVGCGGTCTSCRGDLAEYLAENLARAAMPEYIPIAEIAFA